MNDQYQSVNIENTTSAESPVINAKKLAKPRGSKPSLGFFNVPGDPANEEGTSSGKKEKKDKGPKKGELYANIYAAITRSRISPLPTPNFRIESVAIKDTKIAVIVTKDESCKRIPREKIAELIMKYITDQLAGIASYEFTARDCLECADYWLMRSESIGELPFVRFKNESGLCWNRVPFELKNAPTPHFDEMFGRMENNKAVKAWIGSLFIPESYRQQYIWLCGRGNDGKSSLLNFLAAVFGEEGALAQSDTPEGSHWAESYEGKRLIYFPDFKNFSSLDNGPLKQITGGDKIYINPKYKCGYSADLSCKLIFSSNHMPPVDIQKANLRRIIFAEMRSTDGDDTSYGKKLWDEGGAFLKQCIDTYHELCPRHNPIPTDQASRQKMEIWGARTEDEYELWFRNSFEEVPKCHVTSFEMTQRLQFGFGRSYKPCYEWLRNKGYECTVIKFQGKAIRVYKGLKLINIPADWGSNIHLK